MKYLIEKLSEKKKEPYAEIALILSNFAQSTEKQKKPNMSRIFSLLSASFLIEAEQSENDEFRGKKETELLEEFQGLLQDEIRAMYPEAFDTATNAGDRGALRALTWGKKVSAIQNTLMKRFLDKGEEILKENEAYHVCEACGFIYTGENPPEICPVCKAPRKRFSTVKKRR